MLALLVMSAAASPLSVGPEAWFVEDAVVRTAAAELHLTRGYGFPLVAEGRTVGWAWAGDGVQRTGPGADPVALSALVTRELGASPDPDGAWSTPVDLVYTIGADIRPGGDGWSAVGTWQDDGAGGSTILATPPGEITAARLAIQLAVPARADRLPDLGYPLADLLADPDPARALVEGRVDLNLSHLAGNDDHSDRSWLTTLRRDPLLTPGADSTVVLGTRWVFPPADV